MMEDDHYGESSKTSVILEEAPKDSQSVFLQKLYPEELESLQQLKDSYSWLCVGRNDSFLMKFLWARKLDVDRAAELLKAHLLWRQEWDFEHLNIDGIRTYLNSEVSYWVPGLYTKQGYSASFVMPRNLDLKKWKGAGSQGLMHATYYVTDMASDHDIEIARQGTVLVYDFTGASWTTIASAIRGDAEVDLTKLITSAQDHMPARIREVIVVNPPWYIRLLLRMIKPLLKEKLRQKIHQVNKLEDLKDYFEDDHLLESLGGTRKFDMKEWADTILEARPTLSEGKYIDLTSRKSNFSNEHETSMLNPISIQHPNSFLGNLSHVDSHKRNNDFE